LLGAISLTAATLALFAGTPAGAASAHASGSHASWPVHSRIAAGVIPVAGTNTPPILTRSGKQPRFAPVAPTRASGDSSGSIPDLDPPMNPQYWGGRVLRTNRTVALFWDPKGRFSKSYKNLTVQFLKDMAAASGTKTNPLSVPTEYYDDTGPIAYKSTFAGKLIDKDPYPTKGCKPTAGYTKCLAARKTESELYHYVKQHHIAHPSNTVFDVLTPKGVQSCLDDGKCSGVDLCAYHSTFGAPWGNVVYAEIPFTPLGQGCDSIGAHNSAVDPAIDSISHEQNEAVTDPDVGLATGAPGPPLAWYDVNYSEIADPCSGLFGFAQSNAVGRYNQVINGHQYLLQEVWSNKVGSCVLDALDKTPPTAAFTSSTAEDPNVSFDASGSSDDDPGDAIDATSWDFGDGQGMSGGTTVNHTYSANGTYTVELLVADKHGAITFVTHDVTVANAP
jgi:hypothetical protein